MTSSSITILIVDDSPEDRETFRRFLKTSNVAFEVIEAECADSLWEQLSAHEVDCILLDHRLPGADGLEILTNLSEKGTNIPVIMLTSQGCRTLDESALQLGAWDFLVKGDINQEILERSIRYAMQRQIDHQKLIEAEDRAQTANEHKSQFLAKVSHEIRNPLHQILCFSSFLTDSKIPLPPSQSEFAQSIQNAAKHMVEQVNGLLDLAKIESGSVDLHIEPIVLEQYLPEVVRPHFQFAESKGLCCKLEMPTEHPTSITTDRTRLSDILNNFLSNAIKFTEEGTITLSLRLHGAKDFEIIISDTGIGIPQEKIQEVFEPFQQVDAKVTKKFGGTGLGMAIAKQTAELLGGTLTAYSEKGVGSSFTASLPIDYSVGDSIAAIVK